MTPLQTLRSQASGPRVSRALAFQREQAKAPRGAWMARPMAEVRREYRWALLRDTCVVLLGIAVAFGAALVLP